jgi:5,5'-dehydrodivanillate O-demethylase
MASGISVEENAHLTRIGPGTPMGDLLRRYWHPIAAAVEIVGRPTKLVRLLGESLVLFRDARGRLGLVSDRCPHRGCDASWRSWSAARRS